MDKKSSLKNYDWFLTVEYWHALVTYIPYLSRLIRISISILYWQHSFLVRSNLLSALSMAQDNVIR